jgi:hypothetical protein
VTEGELAYAGFERRGDGLALVRLETLELPPETFQSGLLGGPAREPAALRARVAELVERLGGQVKEASLVLPDPWLRVAFTEAGELPPAAAERDELLRWKLKRLVPFRVEELRLAAAEVEPLPEQPEEEPHRYLLGFAVDALLTQLEDAFAASGVHVGRVTSDSLALLAAVGQRGDAGDGIRVLARIGGDGYTLVFHRHGEPLLHRYKGFTTTAAESFGNGFVDRDLRLTRSFLEEHYPGVPLTASLVLAPAEVEAEWIDRLSATLARAESLGRAHLPPLEITATAADWQRTGPLVGAVWEDVA